MRYSASSVRSTSRRNPKNIDCIAVIIALDSELPEALLQNKTIYWLLQNLRSTIKSTLAVLCKSVVIRCKRHP